MDFWQVVIWVAGGLVALLVVRMLWAAMFRAPTTVSPLADLGRYEASEETTKGDGRAVEQLGEGESDGTWIEIDIEPLFPSSERSPVIDLTVENEPEKR
ncbi:MAG TPA: hypothetical protein VIW46_08425 [Acidimicrobiia bacterium]|jgi:hypothetical protein